MSRYALQTAMRAAAVTLLAAYAAQTNPPLKLQVYPARPRTLYPPTGFVDALHESISYTALHERVVTADVIVVHGLFDSKDAADQKDAFLDGFIDWSMDHFHESGANTIVAVTETDDLPDYVPEWLPPAEQKTYYATRIALEGRLGTG